MDLMTTNFHGQEKEKFRNKISICVSCGNECNIKL